MATPCLNPASFETAALMIGWMKSRAITTAISTVRNHFHKDRRATSSSKVRLTRSVGPTACSSRCFRGREFPWKSKDSRDASKP